MQIEWIACPVASAAGGSGDLAARRASWKELIRPHWHALSAVARPSYFLAWPWVSTWIDTLPAQVDVRFGLLREPGQGQPVGALFLGRATERRHHLIVSRRLHLNMTGDPVIDDLCVEFNTLLAAPGFELPLAALLAELPSGWDELDLAALDVEHAPGNALTLSGPRRVDVYKRVPSYFVDLDAVREKGDYLALLSSKSRAQVRRTYRAYDGDGALTIEAGDSLASCQSIYDELVTLHQEQWTQRGFPGAFATEYFRRFHEELIRRGHDSGEIQLLRVRAGGRTVGCLYNFIYDGTVHQYQSGMTYDEPGAGSAANERDRRPGFVCHVEAIKLNAADARLRRYDFLAGTQQYKQQLSTGQRSLVWARVQEPRVRFWVERGAREVRNRLRQWRAERAAKTSSPVE